MGMSKANELLLLGKKIDAKTALDWNICSQIVPGCDQSGNPFHPKSLGSITCDQIDNHILKLPLGDKTSEVREAQTAKEIMLVFGSRLIDPLDFCRHDSCSPSRKTGTGVQGRAG